MDSNLESLLNLLAEAERAGGRVLHELTEEATSLDLRELLKKVEHDEGYYAGQLAAHVRRLGGTPPTRLVISSKRSAPSPASSPSSNYSIAAKDGSYAKSTKRCLRLPTLR